VGGTLQSLEVVGDGRCGKMLQHLASIRPKIKKLPTDILRPGYSRFEVLDPVSTVPEVCVLFNLMGESDLEELCEYIMESADCGGDLRVFLYGFF